MSDQQAHEIIFTPRQQTSTLLPGEGESVVQKPLATKAIQRAQYSLEKIKEAANGDKPFLGGENKGGKWLAGQIKDMSANGFLLQESGVYFRTREHPKVLGQNPTSHFLLQEKQALIEEVGDINGLRVAGTDIALKSRGKIEREQENSRITVALPGDLNTLEEVLSTVIKKLNGEATDQLLIIENPSQDGEGHFWDEILRSIKILDKNLRVGTDPLDQRAYVNLDALAHHYGIYITEQRTETVKLVNTLDQKLPQKPNTLRSKPTIPENSIFFVATGTMKKFDELARIFQDKGINAKIRSIFELVDMYVSPKELSGTYEGNAAEKIKAAHDAWHRMDEEDRIKRLEHLGITKEQAFFLGEDSGFHFVEPGLPLEDEFGDIRHKIDVNAPFPGVETGPGTIGSNGITNFMEKIRQIFERRTNPDRTVIKKSVIAIAPLKQENYGANTTYMVGAELTGSFTTTPYPNNGAIEIDNYLTYGNIPGLPKGQTEAQVGDRFYLNHSPRALAWNNLAKEIGITSDTASKPAIDCSQDFNAAVITDQSAHKLSQQADDLTSKDFVNCFKVSKLNAEITRAKDPQDKIFEPSDGMAFAFDPERKELDFWRNLYLVTSAIVGQQTHDKFAFLKPMYFINSEHAFDDLIELIYDFHHLGTMPEDPETLIKIEATLNNAIKKMQKDRLRYRRFDKPGYAIKEEPFDIEGRTSNKDFNVGIFMSATTENAKYLNETEYLTEELILNDIGIVTGGGAFGPMGKSTKVAYDMRTSHKAFHAASNVPHIMSGEGDVSELVSEFQVSRDIYERMEFMINRSDSFVITPGGTGTIQELALLALLKQRSLDTDDEYAHEKMANKEIVIVNSTIEHQGQSRGFYDKLIKIIPEKDFDRLGIHVVPTVQQAKQKLLELRDKKKEANLNVTTGYDAGEANCG